MEAQSVLVGRRSRKSPVVWVVLASVLALVAGAAGWYFVWSITPPVEVVRTYLEANRRQDWDTVGACLVAREGAEFKKLPKEGFELQTTIMPSFTYGDTKYENGQAIVNVTARLPEAGSKLLGMSEMPYPIVLVKQGRQWRVDLMATSQAQTAALVKTAPGKRSPRP